MRLAKMPVMQAAEEGLLRPSVAQRIQGTSSDGKITTLLDLSLMNDDPLWPLYIGHMCQNDEEALQEVRDLLTKVLQELIEELAKRDLLVEFADALVPHISGTKPPQ